MDAALRKTVVDRARNRCEYCRLPQEAAPLLTFHVEHILPRQHGGSTRSENLALACPDCNRHKGPNLATVEQGHDEPIPLFNPRKHDWGDHFALQETIIVGKSAIGRATVRLLGMNTPGRLNVRAELITNGEFD